MSRKAVLEPVYITATAATPLLDPKLGQKTNSPPTQSLASSFNTVSTSVKYSDNLSYQINWTTTNSVGAFQLQGSNDNSTFTNLIACGTVSAASDTAMVNINQFPFAYMRLAYTSTTAGTGTCTIVLMGRSIGA